MRYRIIISLLLILCGCAQTTLKTNTVDGEFIYVNSYSRGFEIKGSQYGTILTVNNPWQGSQKSFNYLLTNDPQSVPSIFLEQNGIEMITLPVERVICMSSSYLAFINSIDENDKIVGVSGANFLSNEYLKNRVEAGYIKDIGYDNSINYELILKLNADVIFVYGVAGENKAITDKMDQMGIKVVYVGDYLETTPLGKAEWMIFMSEFFGKRQEAEAIFYEITSEYNRVKDLAQKTTTRPTVMLNAPWRDVWFVPGDSSYMVKLIEDAAGDYICKGVQNNQSRPLSSEVAYIKCSESDIWMNPNMVLSLDELKTMNPKFADLNVVKEGRVYNNNARITDGGGSDFWESGTVNPHIILKDIIKIMHPEVLPEHDFYYFQKLK